MKRVKIMLKNVIKFGYNLMLDNSCNVDVLRRKGVRIGENCRIFTSEIGSEPYLISIGNDVTISNGVQFITHDGGLHVLRKNRLPKADLVGTIHIEDNVFVGANSIMLPNITIGKNSVVGAGSIVTKSIPRNSVAVGNPARVIKSIEEYYEGVKDKVIETYGMEKNEKERIIKKLYEIQK